MTRLFQRTAAWLAIGLLGASATALSVKARNVPTTSTQAPEEKIKSLSDEDILNPKKLVFDKAVVFIDSFDGAPLGQIFITKRSILGSPEVGVIGEKGSENYTRHCLLFCPHGTTEIDASYVYLIEKKGECSLGVRGIGWAEKEEEFQGSILSGGMVETARVRHTSTRANINFIMVNGVKVGPPSNQAQLSEPHGTNYKYFPRNRSFLGSQTTANEGYITDIHIFPADKVVRAANAGRDVVIDMPNWQPSRHVISGKPLEQLRLLTAKCEDS